MAKGIIFDFDGVVIDSEPLRYLTYKKLFLKEFNVELPDDYSEIIGSKQEDNLRHFLDMFGLKGDVDELVKKRKLLLDETFSKKENIRPIKGVIEFIRFLKEKGIRMAIASSSPQEYVRRISGILGILDSIDSVISGEMVKRGKPEPDIFLLAAKKLNLTNNECIVIEDSINGILAANRACIKCFAISSSLAKEKLNGADFIFEDFIKREIFKKVLE